MMYGCVNGAVSGPVVLVLSPRLGDTLLLMTIASNLRRMGRPLTVFGGYIHALADWFPGFDIRALPPVDDIAALARQATVVQMDPDKPYAQLAACCPRYIDINTWAVRVGWRRGATAPNGILDKFQAFSERVLGVEDWILDNGLRPPAGLVQRAHARRIIIHPTSSELAKCWTPDRFARLALRLRQRGFEPVFVLAPAERPPWQALLRCHGLTVLDAPDLSATAAAVYESGWFVGSDSGIGHLASACGLPTVTIVDRPRNMNHWRPAWSPGAVVRPWWLPLRWMRRKYWRQATTVGRVLNTFDRLRADVPE